MLKLGITGGLGTGKSALAELLVKKGLPVLDTDELARQFTQPGQPMLRQIAEMFGAELLDEQGALRRGALALRVFGDADERKKLEQLLHPPIREAWLRQLGARQLTGKPIGVVIIPLLYETQCEGEFDRVICAGCSAATQRTRLSERGWSDAQIDGRLAAQLPLKSKLERADFVVWTEGTMAVTEAQLDTVLGRLDDTRAARA